MRDWRVVEEDGGGGIVLGEVDEGSTWASSLVVQWRRREV